MNEMYELLKKLEGIGAEFDKFREDQYKRFYPERDALLKLISKNLKDNIDNIGVDITEAEQAYYDLIDAQWKMGHRDYGNKIEDNIRFILENIFTDAVITYEKKVADVIVKKDERKLAIEIKSYVDVAEKSRQGLIELSKKKEEAETMKGYEKYIVFAHNTCNEEIFNKCLEQDRQWIILLASCKNFNQKSVPIWRRYKGYYPLGKLVSVVNNFLKKGERVGAQNH